MCTNKLACLVKDVSFQERGSCETRKGLEKEKNVLGEGRRKTVPVFLCFVCSIFFFVVVLAAAASVVFLVFFPEAFFRLLELAGKMGRETAAMPASNRAVMIFRGSALLLPCFVRLQKISAQQAGKKLYTYDVASSWIHLKDLLLQGSARAISGNKT